MARRRLPYFSMHCVERMLKKMNKSDGTLRPQSTFTFTTFTGNSIEIVAECFGATDDTSEILLLLFRVGGSRRDLILEIFER